jgi:hypothetical protein
MYMSVVYNDNLIIPGIFEIINIFLVNIFV